MLHRFTCIFKKLAYGFIGFVAQHARGINYILIKLRSVHLYDVSSRCNFDFCMNTWYVSCTFWMLWWHDELYHLRRSQYWDIAKWDRATHLFFYLFSPIGIDLSVHCFPPGTFDSGVLLEVPGDLVNHISEAICWWQWTNNCPVNAITRNCLSASCFSIAVSVNRHILRNFVAKSFNRYGTGHYIHCGVSYSCR